MTNKRELQERKAAELAEKGWKYKDYLNNKFIMIRFNITTMALEYCEVDENGKVWTDY